ncbi:MAG: glycosyltransferase family 1 protein [Lawsonibacter sp.]|nr:glycosyltransferase family 1 protein [Lawsonibacter sp.]
MLCLSNEPWGSSPGRTQQLLSRLKDAQILYFSPHAGRGDRSFRKKGRRVRSNITVYTLPPPLFQVEERYVHLFQAVQNRLGRFVAAKAAHRRFRSPLLWTTSPEHVHLLDRISYSGLVYDCDREWEGLPPQWEGSLAQAADVVFAASPQLADRLSPCSSNIALLPNGVNYPMFARGDKPRRKGEKPVLGWIGPVWRDLDLSPLLYAARARPDWTFLLAGPQGRNPWLLRLRDFHNVKLLGPGSLEEFSRWMSRCDVLLEFLRGSQPYNDVIPSRLYAYLSTGKPIVSMLWPDQVEQFPDVVYGAHDSREFLTLCSHALEEAPGFVSQRRRDYGAAAAWSKRAGEVSRILETAGLL